MYKCYMYKCYIIFYLNIFEYNYLFDYPIILNKNKI